MTTIRTVIIKILLISGLDGTGLLFEPFIQLLGDSVEATVVNLNDESYELLVDDIVAKMRGSKYILLAESFGEQIAYEVAKRVPNQVDRVIIAASFLSRPTWLTSLRRCLPLRLIKTQAFPGKLVNKMAFGNCASKVLITSFYAALNEIDNEIIRQRLELVNLLKFELQKVAVPCTYVAAKSDYLISKNCYKEFEYAFSNFDKFEVEGGHFIIQSNPEFFARLISSMAKE